MPRSCLRALDLMQNKPSGHIGARPKLCHTFSSQLRFRHTDIFWELPEPMLCCEGPRVVSALFAAALLYLRGNEQEIWFVANC